MKGILLSICCFSMVTLKAQNKIRDLFKSISGTWISEPKKNGTVMGEIWEIINSKEMHGKSFMIKDRDTTILETVRLLQDGNNTFYIPVAYGQNNDQPVSFTLTTAKNNRYSFENPAHDFPRRIVYEFSGGKRLHAYIDDGTALKRQHYYYKKRS